MDTNEEDAGILLNALAASEGYCELQMWQQAWNALEELPDHLRNTAEAVQARIPVLVGTGNWQKALILAGSVSSAFPHRPEVWFRLACAQAAAGDIAAAKD